MITGSDSGSDTLTSRPSGQFTVTDSARAPDGLTRVKNTTGADWER